MLLTFEWPTILGDAAMASAPGATCAAHRSVRRYQFQSCFCSRNHPRLVSLRASFDRQVRLKCSAARSIEAITRCTATASSKLGAVRVWIDAKSATAPAERVEIQSECAGTPMDRALCVCLRLSLNVWRNSRKISVLVNPQGEYLGRRDRMNAHYDSLELSWYYRR